MIGSNDQMTESSEALGHAYIRAKGLEHVSENEMARCLSRCEIEEYSPSRVDGINLAKENELRKSYCVFLRDLGFRLRMPFYVIATSTVFCHRFYLHQSHQKNDRYTIATACMFLAGKVEEARRALDEVVHVSYFIQNKNNPTAAEAFKDKDVCEKQKELVLLAEQVVLVTLDFNLEVSHPYNFITTATSKLRADEILRHVSNIILNDVLYTTLCLQFKPEHIAATALLVAAKLLKFKFPYKGWWREFHVTFQQLEEIYCQIVELYERERGQSVGKNILGIPSANGKESSNANFSGIRTKLKVNPESKSLAPLKRKKTEEDDCTDNSQQSRFIKGK